MVAVDDPTQAKTATNKNLGSGQQIRVVISCVGIMILKSCKVMMTCVHAILSFIKPGYSEQSSRTVSNTGTANAHHGLSMTSIKNETEVLTVILSLS